MLFQKKKISLSVGMLFSSILMSAGAQAQIAPPPDYDQTLSEVVVTATRAGTPLNEIPLNTTLLTPEVLEIAPEQTVDQILKNAPGVQLNDVPFYQKDPTGQSINVRGLGGGRTLVLIDGTPANDAFYGTIEWGKVPMSSIESVEFIRGGVSSLWGNYGMGGVINIKTKDPKNSRQDVSANYGSFNTSNVAASKDIIASDALQLRFSADSFNTDGYQNVATIAPASTANLKGGMTTGKASNENARLQGYFKLSQDTSGTFNTGYSTMADLSSNYGIAKNLQQKFFFGGGTTTQLDLAQKVDVNIYFEDTIFNKQNGSAGTGTQANTGYISQTTMNPYSTLGGSVQYTNELKGIIDQAIIGVDTKNITGSNVINNLNTTGGITSVNYGKSIQNFYGLLGQLKSKASAIPLETTLAARVDYWSSQVPTYYSTGTNGNNPNYQNVPNQNKTQVSPTLGFLYNATKELDFRTSAYQAFHAPGMNNQIRSYGSSSGGYSFGNPNLKPETMTGYELGSDYRWKSGFVQITGFNNFIRDAVATYQLQATSAADVALANSLCGATSSNVLSVTNNRGVGSCVGQSSKATSVNYYTNNQNIQSQGLELQYHHDLNEKWAFDAGYARTRSFITWTTTSDASYGRNQLGGVPQNIASGGITYYPIPKASLTTTVRYVGNSWMDTAHALPVPAYAIVGLRANYELTQNATVYASVVNLLNRNYITFNSSTSSGNYQAGMPQAFTVGARINF